MDRTEFMDRLQRTLAGGVNSSQVAENVRYYQDYIDTEIRKGGLPFTATRRRWDKASANRGFHVRRFS